MAEVRLNIADIIFTLDFRQPLAATIVGDFYRGFVTEAKPEALVDVDWIGPFDTQWPDRLAKESPVGSVKDRLYTIEWEFYRGTYHLDSGHGTCQAEGIFGLLHYLWAVAARLLPERGGLLLHASSVADGKWAYVFPAPSGTGKSTLVRNSPGYRVLSDDGSVVRLIDGQLWAYGCLFRSDNLADLMYGRFPVRGIYFLEQAPIDRLLHLSRVDVLEKLLSQTFLSATDPLSRLRGLEAVEQVAGAVSAHKLQLTKGPGFWRCITNGLYRQTRR